MRREIRRDVADAQSRARSSAGRRTFPARIRHAAPAFCMLGKILLRRAGREREREQQAASRIGVRGMRVQPFPVALDRLRGLSDLEQARCAPHRRLAQCRILCASALIALDRVVVAAHSLQGVAERQPFDRGAGSAGGQHVAEEILRIPWASRAMQECGEVAERGDQGRIGRDGEAVAGERLVRPAFQLEERAEIVQRLRALRLDLEPLSGSTLALRRCARDPRRHWRAGSDTRPRRHPRAPRPGASPAQPRERRPGRVSRRLRKGVPLAWCSAYGTKGRHESAFRLHRQHLPLADG